MSWPWLLFLMVVVAWCAVLSWMDCTTRRLPNMLTLGGAVGALLFRWVVGGGGAAVDGFAGGCLAGVFLLIPFLMRAAGGGDIKMLFAAGCLSGFHDVLAMLVIISLVGGVYGIGMLLLNRVDPARLKHFLRCMWDWRYDRRAGAQQLAPRETERARVPFSIPIAIGLLMVLFGRWIASAGAGTP